MRFLFRVSPICWILMSINFVVFAQVPDSVIVFYENVYRVMESTDVADERIELFKELITKDSFNYLAYDMLGNEYYQKKIFDKALACYNKAIELNYNDLNPLANRGNVYYMLQEYQKALADYDHYIKSYDDEDERVYYGRGLVYYQMGEKKKAYFDFRQAIELNPLLTDPYVRIGYYHQDAKNYERAIKFFKTAMNNGLKDADIYHQLAYSYMKIEDWEPAIDNSNKAIQLDSTIAYYWHNRAYCLLAKNECRLALADLNKAIELYEKPNGTALSTRGLLFLLLGEFKKAQKDIEDAMELEEHPSFYNNLGHLYLKKNQPKKALALVNQSIEMDATNSHAYKNRALIYQKMQKLELACKDARKAEELGFVEIHDEKIDEILKAVCQ